MFGKKRDDNGEKVYRYSIRKYHFGAASVAIAALIFFANGVAKADMAVSPVTANSTHQTVAGGGGDTSGDSGSAGDPNDPAIITNSISEATTPTKAGISTVTTSVENPVVSDSSKHSENTESTTSNVSEKTEIPTVTSGKVQGDVASTETKKVNVTDLKTALAELEGKIASITDEAKKAQLNVVIAEAKKVLADKNATQEQIDSQLTLVQDAVKSVQEVAKKVDEAKPSEKNGSKSLEADSTALPTRSSRRGRGRSTEVQPETSEGATPKLEAANSNKETAPKALPTYTNGTDNYKLAEEMYNIATYLRNKGANQAEAAAIKANADKLNEKLGLIDENAVLSETDFATALADLTAARNTIEAFLDTQSSNGQPTVPGTERSVGDESSRTERSVGQDRDGSNEYKNSLEYYFEDGKKGVSPYDRYTYVFYTSRQSGVIWDGVRKPVEEGRDFIYADVAPTSNGFKWDIYINRARHDLSDSVGWFTLPKGVNVVGNSVTISWSNSEGNRAISPNDGRIETALSQAGLKMVTKGTTKASGIDKRNSGYSKSWNSGDIKALATTGGVNGNNPYKFDLLNNDSNGQALQDAKINAIYNNNGDLYYFQQGADRTTYHLSFETTGITSKRDLIYAAGMKGERTDNTAQPPVRVRFIANQWSAKTSLEKTDADEYSPTITYPAYIVKQGEYANVGTSRELERHPEKGDKLLTYGFESYTKNDFDANNYYHFEARNGKNSEEVLLEANKRGFNDSFRMYRPDGTEISKHDMGHSGADKPGDFEYTWKWVYKDGSKASEHVRFIVVPKEPRLVTNLTNEAGKKNVRIQASGGTAGFKMELYHKVGSVLTKVAEADPNANGEATFVLLDKNNNPRALEVGEYVAKTVANLNKDYRDYAGITHKQEDGLRSGESNVMTATDGVPPVVRMIGSTESLPESRPGNNDPAVYSVTQGDRFAPMLEAFDNTGKMTKFEITNLPNGVTATNLNAKFPIGNNYTEINTFGPATFTGNVPSNQNPGTYTSEIKVSDGVTGDKTYYFKYKVLPVAPTITTPQNQGGTLVSTDRSISGTGIAGSTITVTLQDGTTGTATVNNQGNWTYNLKQNEKLTQNTKQDANTKADRGISITQSKNGAESRPATVDVQLARAISIDTPVQAGRDITVKVPHDAGLLYVQVKNGNNTVYEYGVRKVGNSWQITDTAKANLTELRVTDGKNVSEKVLTFHIKDPKNNIPFTLSATNDVTMRVHYDNNVGNPSDPTGENAGWVTAAKPTNTNPTITVKAPNTRNYTADGSLTMAGLKDLVTVRDQEDDANKTVGRTANENFSVTIRQGNQVVNLANNEYLKKGEYTLTYTTTDAAGATVNATHNITVSSLAEAYANDISYPTDKVEYRNTDVTSGNFTSEIKQSFAKKLEQANPTLKGHPTFTAGTTNETNKVVKVTFSDGSSIDVSHDKVAKPEAPTVTPTVGDKVLSTDRTLKGTGIAGSTITVKVADRAIKTTTVRADGTWEVTLDRGLNSNYADSQPQLVPKDPVKVIQSRLNVESSEKNVVVAVGEARIQPSETGGNSLYAGAKNITVTVPHDSGKFYISYYDAQTNQKREFGVKRDSIGGAWTSTNETYARVLSYSNSNTDTFTSTITLEMKESIKESTPRPSNRPLKPNDPDDDRAYAIANIKENGYGSPYRWEPINVTNEKPTLAAAFQGDKKVVEYGSPLNLNDLVRASDKEDDKNLTRGNGTSVEILSVNDSSTTKAINTRELGRYTVKYRATDSQGKQSDEKTITVEVVDTVKPTVKLVGDDGQDITLTEGTADGSLPKVTVYRGERANVTIKASDNTGKILELRGNGMPNGIWFNKNPNANSEVWLTSDTATETNPLSHTITGVVETGNRIEEKIVTIRATDKTDPANVTTVKFKMVVKEQKEKYTPTAPTNAVNFNNLGTSVTSTEDVKKITDLVNVPDLSAEATNAGGVRKALKNNGEITTENGKKVVTVTVTYPDHSTDEVTVPVAQNYNVVARPTINLKQGETLSDTDKRSLVQLQDGDKKVDIPSDARVEVELDTTSRGDKTASATVVFADNTRTTPVTINYKVLPTFPVAETVYDFVGVTRNQNEGAYYSNPNKILPPGFDWFVRQNGTAKPDGYIQNYLRNDPVGTTSYVFGAKYREGRFSNNASGNDRLEHSGTVSHTVFDVGANTTRIMVNRGGSLSDDQARTAVMPINSSADLPSGTTYEWVNQDGTPLANKKVTEKGEATRYVKVTLPKTAEDGPAATQHQPYKIVEVKINEAVNPTVSFRYGNDTIPLTTTAENRFVIFRGATFNPTLTVNDNSGTVSYLKVSGLPSGREVIKDTAMTSGTNVTIEGDNAATTNAELGRHEASVVVRDASGNEETYKFAYTVEDAVIKETPKIVPLGTKLGDSHDYVNLANSTEPDFRVYPGGMTFKWKKDNAEVNGSTTALNEPGRVTGYKAVVKFPAAGFYTINGVKTYVPESIERDITFLVKPTAPTVTPKDNGDVEVTNENQQNVNKIKVTYTKQQGNTPVEVTYTATKKATGWELEAGAPLTIDSTSGKIKISDAEVRDKTTVKTKAITTDDVESNEANGTVKGATPTAKETTVKHNAQPKAEDSIGNKDDLPAGTTYAWKPDATPNTSTPGTKQGKVIVTYPDTSTEEVDVVVKVTPQSDDATPTAKETTVKHNAQPKAEDSIGNKDDLPAGTTYAWKPDATPNTSTPGTKQGKVIVTYPDTSTEEVDVVVKVRKVEVNGEPEVQPENPGYNGPIGTTGVDENGELIQPPVVDVPEFNGAVNGELPEPTELPKIQLIITKWTDEQGNELKPADAKAPTVFGEANEAFEHGEIEGYVFVRTETKGDVITHVFRKVSPVRPTGDAQQRPTTPSDDTNPRLDTATPAEVPATQPAGQPSQAVEVPAQLPNEVSETNSSVSQPQAVLPNTGIQEDRATGALGALSLLGAFGLLFAKKKKDDEEEA